MLTVLASAVTNVGVLREVNEDAVLTSSTLCAVADGMGGHAAGDVASSIAVEVLGRLADVESLTSEQIMGALSLANDTILANAATESSRIGMGTTVAGLAVVQLSGGAHWLVFNIGDSRVYRYAHGALQQLTVDHSEVEEMVASGALSPADARVHPRRNVVTRCLGSLPSPSPDLWVFPPEDGERFLICSDGLTNEVPDSTIDFVLATEATPHDAAEALVRRALAAGGRDNVSVIVVDHSPGLAPEPVDETTAPRLRRIGSD